MASESETFSQLEIAHVLFMDIVGYSKKPIDQQSELLGQLNQIVRAAEQFRAAEAPGKLVRLPTGDGMALAFFTSVDAPVRCALEVAEALKAHPKIELRMGVDSGPVTSIRVAWNECLRLRLSQADRSRWWMERGRRSEAGRQS